VSAKSVQRLEEYRRDSLPVVFSPASIEAALEGVEPGSAEEKALAARIKEATPAAHLLMYLEGVIMLRAGQAASALEIFRELSDPATAETEVHLRLTDCLVALKNLPAAEDHIKRILLETKNDDSRLWTRWLELSASDMQRTPQELLQDFPGHVQEGYGADVRWLLEQLQLGTVRINCGGREYTDTEGNVWGADRFACAGRRRDLKDGYQGPLLNTGDPFLYLTCRVFGKGDATPRYRIPLPDGKYRVILHFAEVFSREPHERCFDVLIENERVVTDYELLSAGFATSQTQSRTMAVNDAVLDIAFVLRTGNGILSAIEIMPMR
jgi:hypothetical protein